MSRAVIYLDREEGGKRIQHRIAVGDSYGSVLQALRAAHNTVEQRWEAIGPLIEGGETLRIEVSR
jgi:hypothetical protein